MISSMTAEESLWKGSPSQWLNLWAYLGALLLAAALVTAAILFPPASIPAVAGLVIPIFYALWKYLSVRSRVFELTTERLRITRGIINQRIEEIELYRVKDSHMFRTWWMRLAGLASVNMETSDRGTPFLSIPAVRNGVEVRETLRRQVEMMRDRKRVRELDFDETSVGDVEPD